MFIYLLIAYIFYVAFTSGLAIVNANTFAFVGYLFVTSLISFAVQMAIPLALVYDMDRSTVWKVVRNCVIVLVLVSLLSSAIVVFSGLGTYVSRDGTYIERGLPTIQYLFTHGAFSVFTYLIARYVSDVARRKKPMPPSRSSDG